MPELVEFIIGPSPTEDGQICTSDDGRRFYRPGLRIAGRPPGLVPGPDVSFRKDGQEITLTWRLAEERAPGVGDDVLPIPFTVTAVRMVWNGGQRAFDPPAPEPPDGPGAGDARFVLRGGAPLRPDEAKALETTMSDASSGCRLEVDYSYGVLAEIVVTTDGVEHRDPYVTNVTRVLPFVFNPNDEENKPIYRALHGAANLTTEWAKSAAGWVRGSGLPNTVYRIPDEVRLAFDDDLGTPHVVTTLHQDAGQTSVRVLLRVAPWQDPRRVVEVRELAGAPAARVVVAPVSGATLRLGGSFPEGIRLQGGAGSVVFSLADGTDLLMDLSLEHFQLLCGMIGGAVGLPGQVDVTLDASGGPVSVPVPVDLRMDKVASLPLDIEAAGPTTVRLVNRAGTAVRVGGCAAVFLRTEADSVLPVASFAARCTSAFPVELAPGGTADLTFEPVDPAPGAQWNHVLAEPLDVELAQDARAILLRTNELAGSGELTWDLRLSCPVLQAPTPPPQWADVVAVEVEVSAPGFDTTTIALRHDSPARTITMRKPLNELLTGAAGGIRTVSYRVRTNYTDHQGQWTDPQQQSGEDLIVYPTPS
jgi:hypothetical protein